MNTGGPPGAARQLALLLQLWSRHMRRRATRMGDTPKRGGMPTFLLINLLSLAYMAPMSFRAVTRSVEQDVGFFTWNMLGILAVAMGTGIAKGVGVLQVRGMRNDAFLEPLPLAPLARLGLQLADSVFILPLSFVVPLAALSTRGALHAQAFGPALLGVLGFVTSFVLGQTAIAWARSLGPPASARIGGYIAIGLNVVGFAAVFTPLAHVFGVAGRLAGVIAHAWIDRRTSLGSLYAGTGLTLLASYQLLLIAERRGFDRLDVQRRPPKAHKGVRDRETLEWLMLLRQGGRALLIVFGALITFSAWSLYNARADNLPPVVLLSATGFAIYVGVIQIISLAGRAARSDLLARPFLAALPLSPHQVLDGKSRALRRLMLPTHFLLAMLFVGALWHEHPPEAYRIVLAALSLYVVVDGAVSIAFLSNGIGVASVLGGQPSGGFSTQLLMMPLFATVVSDNAWAATIALVAVSAVTWEARRAAKQSVRWIDDPADDLERETTVWRALLAATAFFAVQALSIQMLSFVAAPEGYRFAAAYGAASILLALLTWRNGTRFERPKFLPAHLTAWPVGVLAGAASGALALGLVKLFPPPSAAADSPIITVSETVALFATMTVAAPLIEEYFFRGWLQKAIEADLPARYKRWAFVLGACAFALSHLGTYGVPQLVLGLFTGALYARGRGLWPCILAHAIHNGIVLLVASQTS